MKRIIFLCAIPLLILGCNSSSAKDEVKSENAGPDIKFEEKVHDYGVIEYGANGICEFKFENTGDQPLILHNVTSSCGCTVPEWPKEPIDKGEKGVIKVKYNTKRAGSFQKSVSVYSNSPNSPLVLRIKGTVKEKE